MIARNGESALGPYKKGFEKAAKKKGVSCLWLPTSCEMIVGTRSPELFARLRETFPEGEIEHSHPNYLVGYMKFLQTYWSIRFERMGE